MFEKPINECDFFNPSKDINVFGKCIYLEELMFVYILFLFYNEFFILTYISI